jgi:hypothetical protein
MWLRKAYAYDAIYASLHYWAQLPKRASRFFSSCSERQPKSAAMNEGVKPVLSQILTCIISITKRFRELNCQPYSQDCALFRRRDLHDFAVNKPYRYRRNRFFDNIILCRIFLLRRTPVCLDKFRSVVTGISPKGINTGTNVNWLGVPGLFY